MVNMICDNLRIVQNNFLFAPLVKYPLLMQKSANWPNTKQATKQANEEIEDKMLFWNKNNNILITMFNFQSWDDFDLNIHTPSIPNPKILSIYMGVSVVMALLPKLVPIL